LPKTCLPSLRGHKNTHTSDSDSDCFSTISLEGPNDTHEVSEPTGFEDVEGMELGFGGSPEGLELGGLGQIAEGTPDDR
jgi:hypothetical protein